MARDRTITNDVVSDVSKVFGPRRIEVLNGVERRRSWPDEVRLSIVAEALKPGAIVSHVARRHDVNPSQLFGWLKRYRAEALARRAAKFAAAVPAFAPAIVDVSKLVKPEAAEPLPAATTAPCEPAVIEISLGTAKVRIRGAADGKTIAVVLKALRTLCLPASGRTA